MKVAQIMVDGFEDVEAITTIDLLRRADIKIDTISLFNQKLIKSAHNLVISSDFLLSEIVLDSYDAFILPGGPGFTKYFESVELRSCLIKASSEDKLIAAICAAPSYLADLGLLANKEMTIFPEMFSELENKDILVTHERVIVASNIITGQALGSAIEFAIEIIKYLKDEKCAEEINNSIYY